ncbi:ABC-type transport auxiliary lipoprotein family protein [Massilia sp. Leaf139]|uniref:ABC-type transport auxiliary lipoprotein family protein n=1 Tax=Massilia sp. Leaf139 TaxID=1736272 RepID=UPI001E6217CD|nr:ABC-type transport auxiliary lipoprotein family protein [Massilia sp. Leaf139]
MLTTSLHRFLGAAGLALALGATVAGCASNKNTGATTQFDFGPLGTPAAQVAQAPLAAIIVMDATGSPTFENERMVYRLNYNDPLQARTYANSRWSANPLLLVTQRLKSRLAQAGVKVLSATDSSTNIPILRIEIDDFSHAFSSTTASEGQLMLRASLFNGHTLHDQKTFTRATAATSADAAGGARALAASTDAVAAELIAWMTGFDNRKR